MRNHCLIFALVFAPLTALSATPISEGSAKRCDQVTVHAALTRDGVTYAQFGQGVPFSARSGSNPEFIVTNEHVVGDAQRFSARCGTQEIPVELVKASSTTDLAVLRVAPKHRAMLNTQFSLDSSERLNFPESIEELINPAVRYVEPGPTGALHTFRGGVILEMPSNSAYPVSGARFGYGVMPIGAKPGMSGGALLSGGPRSRFIGLISRSVYNETLSFAIPRSELIPVVTLLSNGIEPDKNGSKSGYYLSHELRGTKDSSTLTRNYQLHVVRADGGEVVLRDACSSSLLAQTSQWQRVGGGDYARPGGGDYARPGDTPEKAPYDFIVNKGVELPANKFGLHDSDITILKSRPLPCDHEGVFLPDGRRLVGLINDDQYRPLIQNAVVPIQSIESLEPIARRKGAALLEHIERNGIFAGKSTFPMDKICREGHLLGDTRATVTAGRVYCYEIEGPSGMEQVNYLSRHIERISQAALHPERNVGTIACDSDRHLLLLNSEADEEHPESVHLEIGADRIKGSVQIGTCKMEVDQPKDLWSTKLSDPNGKIKGELSISLSTVIILRITADKIDPSCLESWRKQAPSRRGQIADFSWHIAF